MDVLNQYFASLVFFKAEYKEDFTLYAAAVASSYGDGKKQYVLLLVPSHMAILDKARIGDLHWSSLQTRILANGYNRLPAQRWNIPRGLPISMFQMIDRNAERSKYRCEDDPKLEMILLHDPKKKSAYQFTSNINIIAALTSFKCVLNIMEAPTAPIPPIPPINPLNIPTRGKVPENIPISRTPIPALAVKMPTPKMNDLYSGTSTYSAPEMIKGGRTRCTTKYCVYEDIKDGGEGFSLNDENPGEIFTGEDGVDGSFELL